MNLSDERRADNLVNSLPHNLDEYSRTIRFLGGLYDIKENISAEKFKNFAQMILPYNNTILAVGWAERRKENSTDSMTVTYIEPQKFESFLGDDLNSDSANRIAIEKARSMEIISMTQPVSLPNNNGTGFIIYRPVFQSDKQFLGVVFMQKR